MPCFTKSSAVRMHYRKEQRQRAFNAVRDFNKLLCERDHLKELTKLLRQVLADLAYCVLNCETNLNETINERVQYALDCHNTCNSIQLHEFDIEVFDEDNDENNPTRSIAIANVLDLSTYNTIEPNTLKNDIAAGGAILPDVHQILDVVDDENLLNFIMEPGVGGKEDSNNADGQSMTSDNQFSLSECLQKLRNEANYLLKLSGELASRKTGENLLNEEKPIASVHKEEPSLNYESDKDDKENYKDMRDGDENADNDDGDGDGLLLKEQQSGQLSNNCHQAYSCCHTKEEFERMEQKLKETLEMNACLKEEIIRLNQTIKEEEYYSELNQGDIVLTDKKVVVDELALNGTLTGSSLSSIDSGKVHNIEVNANDTNSTMNSNYDTDSVISHSALERALDKARNVIWNFEQANNFTEESVKTTQHNLLHIIEDLCRQFDKTLYANKAVNEDLQAQVRLFTLYSNMTNHL